MTERKPNRLIHETSPYLLQHAHNPVDWYPWGQEALDRARDEDLPILLSIGYAACHWCHVMERESFEDETTAKQMNENFVCIKVDREERPDIDSIYMDAVQAMTGHGGWPMTMFLAPDGTPFHGGTYFPPDDRHGLPSFRKVLSAISDAWRTKRSEIQEQGKRLVEHIGEQTRPRPSKDPLTNSLLSHAVEHLANDFDARNGGFGGAPKFPQVPALEFLIRMGSRDLGRSKEMAGTTLTKMAMGGIYDQLGGGFARYSVDERWLVPHFEKMLYDNAQLARAYTHGFQLTGDPLYRRIALETLGYLLRDMRDPEDGFHSSEDADSEGEEGRFYVWSYEEFMTTAPEAADYYGVTRGGNFEGTNILTAQAPAPPQDARKKLLKAREQRIRPGRDDKVLTSWNALTITALAEASAVFDEPGLVAAAEQTASFILDQLVVDGRLLHSYRQGQAGVAGMLEDYAYLAEAMLVLWEVTFAPRWLESCTWLAGQMVELFMDTDEPGFYSTAKDHEKLIIRPKEVVESATPSPNGVASLCLQRLAVIKGDEGLRSIGSEILRLAHIYMAKAPQAAGSFLSSLDFYLSTPKEIVIVGDPNDEVTSSLRSAVWQLPIFNKVIAGGPPGTDSPMLEGKMAEGEPLAYVCENYTCKSPTSSSEELLRQLSGG